MDKRMRVSTVGKPELVTTGTDGMGTAKYLAENVKPEKYGMTQEEFDRFVASIQAEEDFIKSQED